jgi:molybdate transport system substrate-binding protein
MNRTTLFGIVVVAFMAVSMISVGVARAAEVKVVLPASFKEPYSELVPNFEKASGHKVVTKWAGTVEIPKLLVAGEVFDLVIIWQPTIDELINQDKLVGGSRAAIAKSNIAIAVRAGLPKFDIGSGDAVKRALLAAKSIGYSTGPSGTYLMSLFQNWGVADQLKPKLVQALPGHFVHELLTSGKADVGLQQVSELQGIPGVDYLGTLPADIQHTSVLMAAIPKNASSPMAAKEFVDFLRSPQADSAIRKGKMEPGRL